MMARGQKVGTVPLWPRRQASPMARKHRVMRAIYISVPPGFGISAGPAFGEVVLRASASQNATHLYPKLYPKI